ncbi:HNH endonuclease [uncultured Acetatifactor sp.]|uniref:HNH endonuclease n=1 Tax=uncultured Acetatifactor sp. TaxID=1671927 RepID=UPI0026288CC7|nr:HNH endonuclease signature motif containing protein [uncultured Acetatifactor sp.]
MRRKLSKAERRQVYEKCNGHCAYCGCEIPFKGFNVDHVLCMRNSEYMDASIDTVENMLPSCGSCNRYKSTYDLETFRKMLSGIPKRLARDVSTYNIALRFGMVEEYHEPYSFTSKGV